VLFISSRFINKTADLEEWNRVASKNVNQAVQALEEGDSTSEN